MTSPAVEHPSPAAGRSGTSGRCRIRAYALCILVGIVVAVWITERRWRARGGRAGRRSLDIAVWAVPFGIVGARLYHVVTTRQTYFGPGGHPVEALTIWEGGLGIWGAVALGAVGAWIGCRRAGILLPPFADALAPGDRWSRRRSAGSATGSTRSCSAGPTTLPWGLQIDRGQHRPRPGYGPGVLGTFHPTFLYEIDLEPRRRRPCCV